MTRWVVADFETASSVDLKVAGAWRYAESPTTEIVVLAYSIMGGEPRAWVPQRRHENITAELYGLVTDPTVVFIAHNVAFEKAIWRNIMVKVYHWPDIPDNRWHDTMASCAYRAVPLKLERAASVLGLASQKDMAGSKATRALSRTNKQGYYDRSPDTLQRTYDYCLQDIRAETDLHRKVGWLEPREREVWLLDQEVNQRGVALDLPFIRAAQKIVTDASRPLAAEFGEITGGLFPTQNARLLRWANERGAGLLNMQKATLAEVLSLEDEDDHDTEADIIDRDAGKIHLSSEVRRALYIRQLVGSSSVTKLARMDECVCADGRARGLLQYHGTGPGRWAGRLFQPTNLPRPTIHLAPDAMVAAIMSASAELVEMLVGPAVETVVSTLRYALVPRAGAVFVVGDFAGIQARLVLALAGQSDKTALMASGVDVYCDMAASIYKRPIDKKKDPEERQIGKNSVLGLGFQMGARKFHSKYCAEHPFEFAQTVVDAYRKEWAPKVPKVWYALQEASTRAVWDRTPQEAYGITYQLEDWQLSARLPSGRKIWYNYPEAVRRPMPWDETDIRQAWTYKANKMGQWRTINAFGGLLAENVIMGIERDLLVDAMFACREEGLDIAMHNYDEIVLEVPKARADAKLLEEIMCVIPAWARSINVPVAAYCWTGDRYRK